MRSADEGSTILYTVRLHDPGYRFTSDISVFSASLANTGGGSTTETGVLRKDIRGRDTGLVLYTFTPTLQKRATTPKPPRMLASVATALSRIGMLSFGRLWESCMSSAGYRKRTWLYGR